MLKSVVNLKYYSFTIENNEDEKIFKTGYSLICENKIYT